MPTSWRSRLLIGLVVLAAAVGLFFGVRAVRDPSPEIASEAPTSTPSAAPSDRPVAQPKKFRVVIVSVKGQALDSTNMFGRRPSKTPKAAQRAAAAAGQTLTRYLNAAFVDPTTRFTRRPLELLLTGSALRGVDNQDRRALGWDGPTIMGGKTKGARARAVALYKGSRVYAVTLSYTAKMSIVQTDTPALMTQSGTLVMHRSRKGPWLADFADVQLSLPAAPAEKPTGKPSEAASEERTDLPSEGATP